MWETLQRQVACPGSHVAFDRGDDALSGGRRHVAGGAAEARRRPQFTDLEGNGKWEEAGVPRGRGNLKVGFPRERLVEGAWMTVEAAQGNPHHFPKAPDILPCRSCQILDWVYTFSRQVPTTQQTLGAHDYFLLRHSDVLEHTHQLQL